MTRPVAAPPSDLHAALASIQRGEPSHAAWVTVDRFVKTVLPAARDADARQATLLSIHRRIDSLDATTSAAAGAWVRRIAHRKKIDAARRQRRAPLSLVGAEGEVLDVPTEGGSVSLDEERLGETLAEIEASLDRLLEERHPAPAARVLPRAQARARLLRTLGLSVPEIAEALALPDRPTEATLSKWIERGLPLLVEAVERWQGEAPGRGPLAEGLISRIEARRSDAGRPRPGRRLSVPPGGARRRWVRHFAPSPALRRACLLRPGRGRRRRA
jgi:DNA-directed RNA polymerase specialized sigma24 family protein